MKLSRSGSLSGCVSRHQVTSTFSTPWSARTLEGKPFSSTVVLKSWRTVAALLLQLQCKYIMICLKHPSTPLCITNPHLTKNQTSLIDIRYHHNHRKEHMLGIVGTSHSISGEQLKAYKYQLKFAKLVPSLLFSFAFLWWMSSILYIKQPNFPSTEKCSSLISFVITCDTQLPY